MINKACGYYDGDYDCHKCAQKGYISDCSGCKYSNDGNDPRVLRDLTQEELCDLMCGVPEDD